ncbi:MAG TPA: hypothetical protein VLG48_05720 [Candidatus Methylomirabilis sp.]|nr:hypothetical protein [Candidatus Methylomirabilis sp.]
MLKRLGALWCERHGHQYREVGRVYAGPEGQAQEVFLQVCRLCGARRDQPSMKASLQTPSALGEQARLDFLARMRRHARRRAARKGRSNQAKS